MKEIFTIITCTINSLKTQVMKHFDEVILDRFSDYIFLSMN